MTRIKGIGAAKGRALGTAFVIEDVSLPQHIETKGVSVEKVHLEEAKQKVISKLNANIGISQSKEAVEILNAHLLFIEDPEWLSQSLKQIESGESAYNAVKVTGEQFALTLEQIDDSYLKERSSDIRDLTRQWLEELIGHEVKTLPKEGSYILVAEDLSPGLAAVLDPNVIVGIVAEKGSKTSHTAIIANNLGIPAVLGAKNCLHLIAAHQRLAIDGGEGIIEVEPDPELVLAFQSSIQSQKEYLKGLETYKTKKATTLDGVHFEVSANIGSASEASKALEGGAEGVGLFRTEFVYMESDHFPTVEEQSLVYIDAVKRLDGRPMIFRTFDIGGDKSLSYFEIPQELNPFMGYRALRICLNEPELFKTQVKAMLIASHYGPCKIMFPMVSSLDEFREAKAMVLAVMAELKSENVPFDEEIALGIMVEVPSVAAAAELYAKEVDFFSVGTNDLTQYTLAVDRMNEAISDLYDPFNPGVIHLLATTYKAAKSNGIMGGMCGELAGNVLALPLLMGLGISELSMSLGKITAIKAAMSRIKYSDTVILAEEILKLGTSSEIQNRLKTFLSQREIAY